MLAPAPPGPPAWLQKTVEKWNVRCRSSLSTEGLTETGDWTASIENPWKPELGWPSTTTERRWLLIIPPVGWPLSLVSHADSESLALWTAQRGWWDRLGRCCVREHREQTLGLFPGRCCPLLVESLPVLLCWDILPKFLTVLGKRARSYLSLLM